MTKKITYQESGSHPDSNKTLSPLSHRNILKAMFVFVELQPEGLDLLNYFKYMKKGERLLVPYTLQKWF